MVPPGAPSDVSRAAFGSRPDDVSGHRPAHTGRAVHVAADGIISTVAGWLAELGVHSPLVADSARMVRDGEWAAAYAIADFLSIDVTFAP